MKPDIIYFDHDANARRDPKMISLISDYGAEGYGRFWMLIEYLREQQGVIELTKNNLRAIAYEIRCETTDAEKFIESLIELKLLRTENGFIFSDRLNKNIEHLKSIREKRRSAAEARWKKNSQDGRENANAMVMDANAYGERSNCNANASENDAKKSKEKKSKEEYTISKNSKTENNFANFQPPNFDLPLPLLTNQDDFTPEDFYNRNQVTESVIKLLNTFCNISVPKKEEVTSFVNVIMNTKQVKNQTAFNFVFNSFKEFGSLPEKKKNLAYLYTQTVNKINDALIEAREKFAEQRKEIEKVETNSIYNSELNQIAEILKVK